MPKDTFDNLPQDKRERIQRAATEEFAAQPFEKASLSRIARIASIAKGSLYQYFDNKVELYQWLLEQAGQRKWSFLKIPMAPPPGELFAWYGAALRGGLRFMRAEPQLARLGELLMQAQSPALQQLWTTSRRASVAQFTTIFADAKARGELRDDVDPHVAAHLVVSMNEVMFALVREKAGADDDDRQLDPARLKALSDEELDGIAEQLTRILADGVGAR